MGLARDIWRVGVIDAPIDAVVRAGGLADFAWRLLPPEPGMCFLADPFALVRDGVRHVFAERYDYRDRHGVIDWLRLEGGHVAERATVLRTPWHLSYPFVFEAEGAIWMLPEAYRSGRLTLYRAVEFPRRWEAAAEIALDAVAVDPTLFFENGLWWLFYTPALTDRLHCAFAEALTGPWRPHPGNPIRSGAEGARPGGTPLRLDGQWVLPVQDCVRTYGAAIRPLRLTRLDTDRIETDLGAPLAVPPALAPYRRGFHTLAAMGDQTLFDAKRITLTPYSVGVLALRSLRAPRGARR
ncbi:glucosamine inositolphosphorylceramide transferase family protein [Sphingomonas morindae]|uniref:Formyl transferase n=1 Tax=Sphingomonas morindae TaxID=1541170 RepID=A0ABY4X8Y7_9SPHN|nr:formyl transferase [Sphingomonas morindae]USI73146.1 formyl transferase [Sphingomonas morindae]